MREDREVSPYRHIGWVTSLGFMMIACIMVGLFFGLFLDERFNTSPWCAMIFMIAGMLSGVWSVFKGIMRDLKRDDKQA